VHRGRECNGLNTHTEGHARPRIENKAMMEINLTHGYVSLIDDEDYPLISRSRWFLKIKKKKFFYARTATRVNGKTVHVDMHRLLMNPLPGVLVDHINGNGLDNQRCNLRLATNAQNQQNRFARHGGSSRFKGVNFDPSRPNKPWRSQIYCNGVKHYLGRFNTEEEAALVYDATAQRLFGAFCNLNFPVS
jgi:HNH endonuclease/AP2 domain